MTGGDDVAVNTPRGVLEKSGVAFNVVNHMAIRSQRDIEENLDLPVERSIKTLVFQTPDGRVVLAVIPGPSRLNYRGLAGAVGVSRSQLRAADPAVLDRLGMAPGGASPLCDQAGVTTVFDPSTVGMGLVYCGSGSPDTTFEVDSDDLVRLAPDPIIAAITG